MFNLTLVGLEASECGGLAAGAIRISGLRATEAGRWSAAGVGTLFLTLVVERFGFAFTFGGGVAIATDLFFRIDLGGGFLRLDAVAGGGSLRFDVARATRLVCGGFSIVLAIGLKADLPDWLVSLFLFRMLVDGAISCYGQMFDIFREIFETSRGIDVSLCAQG